WLSASSPPTRLPAGGAVCRNPWHIFSENGWRILTENLHAARRRMSASPRVALRVRSAARRVSQLSGAGAARECSDDLVGEAPAPLGGPAAAGTPPPALRA